MSKPWVAFLLGAIVAAAPAMAQEQPPETPGSASEEASEAEPVADKEAEEELPEIDVWAEDGDADDDVFIPSESISADSSISFPADI